MFHGNEPRPSVNCLNGEQSWGKCQKGAFLCLDMNKVMNQPESLPQHQSNQSIFTLNLKIATTSGGLQGGVQKSINQPESLAQHEQNNESTRGAEARTEEGELKKRHPWPPGPAGHTALQMPKGEWDELLKRLKEMQKSLSHRAGTVPMNTQLLSFQNLYLYFVFMHGYVLRIFDQIHLVCACRLMELSIICVYISMVCVYIA